MSKKQILQNTISMKTKNSPNNSNAKVTVQYIESPQLYRKVDNGNHNASQEDLEIENVEYLEENTNVEEYIDESGEKDEDCFYPNAIHCLLDLYKIRYNSLVTENTNVNVAQIWQDIAKDMQESFFDFNEHQIKLKYAALREHYFSLQTKDEIENFDYFEQLHEIYKDEIKETILKGHSGANASSQYHKDELLLQPRQLENDQIHMHDLKSEEITHKENELIHIVEKELQAIKGEVKEIEQSKYKKEKPIGTSSKNFKSVLSSVEQPQHKRLRLDTEFCEDFVERRRKSNEFTETSENYSGNKTNENFSLYLYNQEQEKRHREKMVLLGKSLKIQERALEQQTNLLRELIKRLPS